MENEILADMTNDELKQAYVNLTEQIATGLRVAEKMETGFGRRATLNEVGVLENQLLEVQREMDNREI